MCAGPACGAGPPQRYSGSWKNGQYNGWGILSKSDNTTVEGTFVDNLVHGVACRVDNEEGDVSYSVYNRGVAERLCRCEQRLCGCLRALAAHLCSGSFFAVAVLCRGSGGVSVCGNRLPGWSRCGCVALREQRE
jgi:hypothetical protein